MTDATAALAARARCPACLHAPLSVGGDVLACTACGARWPLLSRQPLAVRLGEEGLEALGEQFEAPAPARSRARRAVRRWHARRDEAFAPRIPALAESQLPVVRGAYDALPAGGRAVLDVGGGAGRWHGLLGGPPDYTIVDVIPPQRVPLAPGITYVQADATSLPFSGGSFGLVLMIEVLHHLKDPATALAEARRVLADGGSLVLTTRQAWRTLAPSDYFRFTRYGLEHLLHSAGLAERRVLALGGPASVFAVTLESNVRPLGKPLVKQLVTHPLWRLAALLDRTVFRDELTGPTPDVSGWLVVATPAG